MLWPSRCRCSPAYDQADADAREHFLALLRGQRPVDTLSRMARLGVLGQWIPAFAQVSGRMQFDLFHVYTVDQHTLMVLRNIGQFASSRADERFSIAHEVWPRLRKPELLLLVEACSMTSPRAAAATTPSWVRWTRVRSARHMH